MDSTRTSPRTVAKNKGVGNARANVLADSQNVHKAVWDYESTQLFLQLIADEIVEDNRPFMVLSSAGYKSLAKKFEKKNGRKHDVKQLKNKYTCLKREWTAWMKLMNRTKGITRIGFDAETGMFQASDEWWDRMELINKSCAKFRTKTLEHQELMEIVFTGAAATSRHHWTPGERTVEDNEGSSDSVQSLGMRSFADPIPSVGIDVDAESSMEAVEPTVDPGTKRKRNTPASSGKSRKSTSGASAIADNVNNLSNVVRTKNQEVTMRHLTGNESLYTISECMDRLKSIPALVGTPYFHFASSLMDNANYREVIMCQPDDDNIIGWLMQKQLQSSTVASFVNLFGARQV